MSRRSGGHPTESDLFLHLEGELDARSSRAIEEHLRDCWECRVACQELERGIATFIEYRREVQIPSPAAPLSGLPQFRQRVMSAVESKAPLLSSLFRALSPRPLAFTSAVSILLVIVLLGTYTLRPPSLTASELFRFTAQAAAAPVPARNVKAQRIQVRRGLQVLEREILHGAVRRASSPEREWNTLLGGVPVDPIDPLNPGSFQRWHEAQQKPHDTIVEADGLVTLTTTVPSLRAALIVRRSDWHTVAKRFEFPGQPVLEIREVLFEVRAEPAIAAASPPPPLRAAPVAIPPAPVPPPVDLDMDEIRIRELFRHTGADRNEVPAVTRIGDRLRVTAVVESADRREALTAAFEAVPAVDLNLSLPAEIAAQAVTRPLTPAPPAYPTEPPLARELWESMGGMEPANNYMDMLRDAWRTTLTAAGALARLAERYPASTANDLRDEVHSRVVILASEYRQEVAENLEKYLRDAAKPLDAVRRPESMPSDPPTGTDPACSSWQETAVAVPADLRKLQTSLRRMFLVDYIDTPTELSAGPLLQDAELAHFRLQQQLVCLRQP